MQRTYYSILDSLAAIPVPEQPDVLPQPDALDGDTSALATPRGTDGAAWL